VSSSIPSSTSSSSAEPAVSVVIGSNAPQALDVCLAALEPQRNSAEVLVCEGEPSHELLRSRFPWATFVTSPGALVPELWRDGIERSNGRIVALTIAQMVPAEDWLETIVRTHEEHDAVGGAIDPGKGLRLVDWAEYFCRYSRDMRPFTPADDEELAGDNVAFKRSLLERHRNELRSGYWEPVLHPALRRDGTELWHTPDLLVRQGRSAGFAAFARQRLEHGRRYGRQRGEQFSRPRNLAGVLGAPLVPFLMTVRVLRRVLAKGRFRRQAVVALPLIFTFNALWAYAEARGHAETLLRR
jgi:hypothetical protein